MYVECIKPPLLVYQASLSWGGLIHIAGHYIFVNFDFKKYLYCTEIVCSSYPKLRGKLLHKKKISEANRIVIIKYLRKSVSILPYLLPTHQ